MNKDFDPVKYSYIWNDIVNWYFEPQIGIERCIEMAWWDHEELKPVELRSDKYKVAFPEFYTKEEVEQAKQRITEVKITVNENEFNPPKRYDSTKAEQWWAASEKYHPNSPDLDQEKKKKYWDWEEKMYKDVSEEVYANVTVTPEAADQIGEMKDTPVKGLPTGLKFNEDKYLEEVRDYLASTYEQHYASGKVQTFELIESSGQADGFTMGSVMKYASRYGKKNGYNRKDLLKIIHYAMLQLYVHDKNNRG